MILPEGHIFFTNKEIAKALYLTVDELKKKLIKLGWPRLGDEWRLTRKQIEVLETLIS